MQTVEIFVVMLVIVALMYPKTNKLFCDTLDKVSFGYAKCDNVVGVMVCMIILMALMVYQNRLMFPRSPAMVLTSPFPR
jgi:hypothetical protein